jgi:thymidylate kinase
MYVGQQRLVFLEGCDRTGKTNIAKALSAATGIPRFKATSEHDAYLSSKVSKRELFLNQLRYADPRVCDLLKQTGQSVIFDRGFPSEYVYSQVMNRETDMKMLMHLDEEWSKLGTIVIICHRSSYEGIVDDLDPKITASVLQTLTDMYKNVFASWSKCKIHTLCVDDEDLQREVNDVLSFIGWRVEP